MNQVDPLHKADRTGEFENSSAHHYQNELDRVENAFARLVGADWPNAWKVTEDYIPKPRNGWYYGETSVFEVGHPPVRQ